MRSFRLVSFLIALVAVCPFSSDAQTFSASLTGNPVNTTGWVLGGNAVVSGTDINLTQPTTSQLGYVYYNTAVNLTCGSFTATFDFKMSNHSAGSPADGLAFFYSTTPPSTFTSGGAIGLPNSMTGFAMIFDTYDNDANSNNPLIALRNFNGSSTVSYTEGSSYGNMGQADIPKVNFLTDGNWHTCVVSYSGGIMSIAFDGNPPITSFPYNLTINGYFGFTAATGASYSLHSLRNVFINAFVPVKPALASCNLDSGLIRFTGARASLSYNWYYGNGTAIGTGNTVTVPVTSTPNSVYAVLTTPVAGCKDTLISDTFVDFTINASPKATCLQFGTQIQLNTTVSGGMPTTKYGYGWTGTQASQLSCTNCPNPVATPFDTSRLVVTVTDHIGCKRRDTVGFAESPDAGPDRIVCPLGERPAQLHVIGPSNATFRWYDYGTTNPGQYLSCTTCQYPTSAPVPKSWTYVVGYDGCATFDTITVYHDTTNYIVTPQDVMIQCRPGYRQIISQAFGPQPKANIPCGTNFPITCTTPSTITAGSATKPPAVQMNTPFATTNNFLKYQFIIKKQDLLDAGMYGGTINVMSFKTLGNVINAAGPIDNMFVSLGCIDESDFALPTNNNSFYGSAALTTVATIANYNLTANAWNDIVLDAPYSWDTSKNLLVDICIGPLFAPDAAGMDAVAMEDGVAIQKYSSTINVCGGNATTSYRYNQRPTVRFSYCETPDLPFDYTWMPGTQLKDSTQQNTVAYIARSQDYAVYTVGRNGCRVRDSLHIIVPQNDVYAGPQDTSVCEGQPAFLYANGAEGYRWYEFNNGAFTDASASLTCTDCGTPTARLKNIAQYAVVFLNQVGAGNPANPEYLTGCPDTTFLTVNVRPLPKVVIPNADTMINIGRSVALYAQGAQHYTWTPQTGLSDPNSPVTIARPEKTTTYIVYGSDEFHCMALDSVTVSVNYHTPFLIPSAFTPNGDGRNDYFRIVGREGMRLLEFRIFNRWGQQVFSTTNINTGWDGTFDGKDAEMGTYQYLIRVGYLDNVVDTFNGTLELVR